MTAPTRHLGLDLGATNLKWAVIEGGETVDRGQMATRTGSGANGIIEQLVEIGRHAAESAGGLAAAGIGVPGRYDPATGRTRFIPNIPGEWAGLRLADAIRRELGLWAYLINDARACALAELRLGAGRGAATLLVITLGTGVGGGIAIDGRLYMGHDGAAGEFGHQTVRIDGPLCRCGNRGCLEPLANAAAIASACGTPTVEAAVSAAAAGDHRARAGLTEIGRWLGVGVSNAVVLLTPDRVVIGGGVAGAGDLLLDPVREEVRRRVHITDASRVEVIPAALGMWAGAIGAALHGADRLG